MSTTDRQDAEPVDSYLVAGVGWLALGRETGTLVTVTPLLKDGATILEQIGALIFLRGAGGGAR